MSHRNPYWTLIAANRLRPSAPSLIIKMLSISEPPRKTLLGSRRRYKGWSPLLTVSKLSKKLRIYVTQSRRRRGSMWTIDKKKETERSTGRIIYLETILSTLNQRSSNLLCRRVDKHSTVIRKVKLLGFSIKVTTSYNRWTLRCEWRKLRE